MTSRISLSGAAVVVMTLALLSVFSGRASAQTPLGPPSGLGVGVFIPNNDWAKQGGDTQFAADFKYNFMGIPLTDTRTVLDIGYEGGTHNGTHSYIVPLTLGETLGLGGGVLGKPYVGAGAGGYYIDQSHSSVTTRLGAYISAGYKFTALFAEARYQWVDKGDGLTLNVGLTF
ncbi:MAG: hypothetical protein P4L33_06065 [Capsulimonadaceae bacterium]|nr:hypothetical protein [Capsulimonadaceae bacterium]